MKFGMRKPSIKRSIKARTTGRMKRAIKSSVNPLYGKKGIGWIRDPKRAAYNKIYKKINIKKLKKVENKIAKRMICLIKVRSMMINKE